MRPRPRPNKATAEFLISMMDRSPGMGRLAVDLQKQKELDYWTVTANPHPPMAEYFLTARPEELRDAGVREVHYSWNSCEEIQINLSFTPEHAAWAHSKLCLAINHLCRTDLEAKARELREFHSASEARLNALEARIARFKEQI